MTIVGGAGPSTVSATGTGGPVVASVAPGTVALPPSVLMDQTDLGLYPAEDLFPADGLFPRRGGAVIHERSVEGSAVLNGSASGTTNVANPSIIGSVT